MEADVAATYPASLTEAAAAAAAAAAAQIDDTQSANAYAATPRVLGYGMCASATALSSSATSVKLTSTLVTAPHGFTTYCDAVCAGSIYGHVVAAHTMTKDVACTTLALFIADISAKMKSPVPIKPHVVNCDNGSAFVSRHFREFLADRQIQLRFSPPYTPQLNNQIEAM